MERVLATELRSKPAVLGALPRRYDSSPRRFANSAGHQFGSVAIVSDELTAKLPSPFLRAVSARLYEEDLQGQPSSDTDDKSEATPVGSADVAVPMSDVVSAGGVQTGATHCDTATGKVVVVTLNTDDCTKDCSTKHEEKHAADIGPCCTRAGAASKAAKSDADKTDIQDKFDKWMLSNKPFLECRAYAVSESCGNAKHKALNCEKQSYTKCCKNLVWYIRSAINGAKEPCAQADKKLSECPFS